MASNRSDSSGWSGSESFEFTSNVDNIPPTVNLNIPNGGERWDALSHHDIGWNDNDDRGVSAYKLEYSTNGGTSWTQICDWTNPDNHSFNWNLPDRPSRQARIRVSCRDAAGNVGIDTSDRNFKIRDIVGPHVTVLFPSGGDTLEVGCDTSIVWEATDNIAVDSFMIDYSIDNGSSWQAIAPWTSGNPGSYAWAVPSNIMGNCLVRAFCIDPDSNITADTSSGYFLVRDSETPSIAILSPAQGDSISADSIGLSWQAQDNGQIALYRVEYCDIQDMVWTSAYEGPGPDSGSFNWPCPAPGNFGLRVSCFDMGGNYGLDSVFFTRIEPTGIEELTPSNFALMQSYPNPFNPSTTIKYSLAEKSHVRLEVFDLLGNRVVTLVDQDREAGSYQETWQADGVASGVYIYKIEAGNFRDVKKTTLLR
jgi:hypothetical protein